MYFLEMVNSLYKFANVWHANVWDANVKVHNCLLVSFCWILGFKVKNYNIYVTKATKIIRETFQYARKVGGMFSAKEGMRNGNHFVQGKEINSVLELDFFCIINKVSDKR